MTRDTISRTFTNLLIAASAALAGSCSGSTEPTSPVAARLVVLSGDGQHAVAGQLLPEPVSVQVLDSSDHPMPDQTLTFEVLSGGGSLSLDSAATNGAGMVSTSWTLGPEAGAFSDPGIQTWSHYMSFPVPSAGLAAVLAGNEVTVTVGGITARFKRDQVEALRDLIDRVGAWPRVSAARGGA